MIDAPIASRLLLLPVRRKAIAGLSSAATFFKTAQLRTLRFFKNHFQTAVVIEIGQGERSAVFDEVQPDNSRDIRKRAVAIVGVEHIAFVAAPRAVRADQLVDGVPPLFVVVSSARILSANSPPPAARRNCSDLPGSVPEIMPLAM